MLFLRHRFPVDFRQDYPLSIRNCSDSAPDPAPAGFDYGIEVVISSTDSADTIAAATAAAIDANYYYNQYFNPTGYISGSDVVITSNTVGDANDIADGSTATNFAFAVTTEGCAHGRAAGTVWPSKLRMFLVFIAPRDLYMGSRFAESLALLKRRVAFFVECQYVLGFCLL